MIRILTPGVNYTPGHYASMIRLSGHLAESGVDATFHNLGGPFLPEVRNKLLLNNQPQGDSPFQGDYDYIMWIETDISFEVHDFFNLYSHAVRNNLSFVTGLFPMGLPPMNPTLAVAGRYQDGRLPMSSQGLQEIDYCGVGFLLVRKGVYEKLGYPWYGVHNIYAKDNVQDKVIYMGDDFSTARAIQKTNITLYANCDVKVKHEKLYPVTGQEGVQ